MTIQHQTVGPLAENCYLIASDGRGVLVDPGDEAERLLAWLDQVGVTLEAIWLTHAHFDHVGAIPQIKARTGVPVVMHQADLPILRHTRQVGLMYGLSVQQPDDPDQFVREGDVLTVGELRFEVRHTPGHSPGGIVLVGDGVAIVGDSLFKDSVGRADLPGGDWETLLHSIQAKILALPDETRILPGHGPATTVGRERQHNPFLVGASPKRGGRL